MTVAQRREREREARRHHILDAAQRVFYARGFALATMEEVAEEAQLGKGTLYIYFRTKEDLLAGVASRHQRRMIGRFEQETTQATDGLDTIRRMLLAYADHMAEPREHLKMVVSRWAHGSPLGIGSTCADAMRDNVVRFFGMMRDAIEEGQQDGSIRADGDPARLAMKLWSCVNGALLLKLQLCCVAEPHPLSDFAPEVEETVDLLLDAVRPTRQSAPSDARHPLAPGDSLALEAEAT